MKISIFCFCCFLHFVGLAQPLLFQKGDRVAFVGNSITNNGEFHHNIFQYYVTRFPEKPVTFFNCGISGDVTGGILSRMDDDILVHNPTHVVLMIGMNDVKRSLYGPKPTTDTDTLTQRREAIRVYKANLDSLVRVFSGRNIKVILQKPTIYDQTARLKTATNLGVNDALKQCADYTEELARKYRLPIVDYWTILNAINTDLQKKDPTATIIGPDRVHPASAGHLIMAYQFLTSMQSPGYVSRILIDRDRGEARQTGQNGVVLSVKKDQKRLRFTVKENALPFATVENQKQALALVPFTRELNQQELAVTNLPAGAYQVLIDTTVVDTLTAEQLKKGINLAEYSHSPQYKQALAVRAILADLWRNEANLRTIKWVEIGHLKECKNREDLQAVKAFLAARYAQKYQTASNSTYYQTQFDKYLLLKPLEETYKKALDELREKAYRAAVPVAHQYTLIKLPSTDKQHLTK
ncbi:SGNH/GDSL hydrolase family protein [Spirosoma sordidisoli]|uniref:SGNH hydrolase-type esterase domain-containing protein n=1 Tax=Spirosoma sordidisoli TaxID=2502893 RepID=A0A4Q2UMU8_9BACT|nr:SGNH/GDSL hydrolase family protein [Spirosoma sordidisoli]RYC70112.1 hypothetical protein EQG79_09585 [Spirosoma sordidisoli]